SLLPEDHPRRRVTALDRGALGDGGWNAAEPPPGLARRHLRQRAAVWYSAILAELTGINKLRIEKRLPDVEPEPLWPIEFRIRVAIDGKDILTVSGAKLAWNHAEADGPGVAQVNHLPASNPKKDRALKLAGKTRPSAPGV